LRFEDAGVLARSLLAAHAKGVPAAVVTAVPEALGEQDTAPTLEILRERLSGPLPKAERARWVAALVRAGHSDEARAWLVEPGSIPFSHAWVALEAAALCGDAEMAKTTRAEIDALPTEVLPPLVSVAPGAACAVLGVERALDLASHGDADRVLDALSTLLPHLPRDAERARAAEGAFAAWNSLPQDHDAAGAILRVVAWLPRGAVVAVLDRMLASSARFTIEELVSEDEPGGLAAQLPVFETLGGAAAVAAAWDALAVVAHALEADVDGA
jgi:hypothetical protein